MTEQTETPEEPDEGGHVVETEERVRTVTPYERKLRTEAANARAARKIAEQAAADAKAGAAAEIERANKMAREAADARVIRAELKAAAMAAGMVDLDAIRIIDTSAVRLNDAGDVVLPDGFFAAVKAAKPYLFGQPSTSSTAAAPPAKPPTAKDAREMTADEWRAARAEAVRRR